MAAKSATAAAGAAKSKKASTPAAHGSYKDMIKAAIVSLKERTGSSRQAIKKYVQANNPLGTTTDAALSKYISQALSSGEKSGEFIRPKGPSGPVKLGKAAPAKATKTATKPKVATTTKKAAAPKKAATTTKKAAAPKTKANSAKPRKTAPKKAAAAPAVEEKKAVDLGKTKSGRVHKSKAPASEAKKTAPKKAAAAAPKKAAPKKSATPKKAA